MKTTEVKGNQEEQKIEFRQIFSVPADSDLMYEERMKGEMFGKLEMKLKKRVARDYYGEKSIFFFA